MEQSRLVTVPRERLDRWLAGFVERHGEPATSAGPETVVLAAPDGARAECEVPAPPLRLDPDDRWLGLPAHVDGLRRIGVLLLRRGGYSVGVFAGEEVVASKTGTRYVQGRTAAGGQSQQRFARRRANQATALVGAAVAEARRVLGPYVPTLDALFPGGDRQLVAAALADRRLARVAALPRGRLLEVGEPRLATLRAAAADATSVRIRLTDP